MSNAGDIGRVNPFHVQWDSKFFVGRQDELRIYEQNLAGLKHGQQSHHLVAGVHGTGKSFYLHKLAEIAKSANCAAVIVDCAESAVIEQARSLLRDTIAKLQPQLGSSGSPLSTRLGADFEKKEQSQFFSLPKRSDLSAGDLESDFTFLAEKVKSVGRDGLVVCIDEGQRATRILLSCLKNALSRVSGVLIVLSWRLASDARGAVVQARQELLDRVSDTDQDKDIGAASFFSSATAMGPFKTDAEVIGYFRARLTGNMMTFSPEVVSRLGEIANRVPRPMTELAHDVYDAAVKVGVSDVDIVLLDESFRNRYSGEIKQATDLCADLSADAMAILKALCRLSEPTLASDIAKNAFPGAADAHYEVMGRSVGAQLDKLCQTSAVLLRADSKYAISNSFNRYALRLTLGTT